MTVENFDDGIWGLVDFYFCYFSRIFRSYKTSFGKVEKNVKALMKR